MKETINNPEINTMIDKAVEVLNKSLHLVASGEKTREEHQSACKAVQEIFGNDLYLEVMNRWDKVLYGKVNKK